MIHARDDYNRIQDPENLIPADEPVFLLRGQDKFAAEVVRYWADLVADATGDTELFEVAYTHADRMDDWPTKKIPDLKGE